MSVQSWILKTEPPAHLPRAYRHGLLCHVYSTQNLKSTSVGPGFFSLPHTHFKRRWRCDASAKKKPPPPPPRELKYAITNHAFTNVVFFCTARLNVTKQRVPRCHPTLQQSSQSLLCSANRGISTSLWIRLLLAWVIVIWRKDWDSIFCFMLVIPMRLPIQTHTHTAHTHTHTHTHRAQHISQTQQFL